MTKADIARLVAKVDEFIDLTLNQLAISGISIRTYQLQYTDIRPITGKPQRVRSEAIEKVKDFLNSRNIASSFNHGMFLITVDLNSCSLNLQQAVTLTECLKEKPWLNKKE